MEGLRWKVEFMKPVILKVGIPLAVSVAGLIWAKIIARQRRLQNNDSFRCKESDDQDINGSGRFEDEVLRLRKLVESVEEREERLEMQFLRFCEMKDRETVIMEIGKMLKMEMAKVEMTEELEKENGVLKRKVTKLWRIVREQLSLIRENEERIAAVQEKMGIEDDQKTYYLNKIDDEMKEMRRTLDDINLEKCQILENLSFLQQSISKMEKEALSMEEYRYLENEVEHLQEEDVTEEEEVARLRWSNANCLSYEVHTELQDQQQNKENNCLQLAIGTDEHEEEHGAMVGTSSSLAFGHLQTKKKKKLLHKLRKWVEVSENRKVKPSDDEMK